MSYIYEILMKLLWNLQFWGCAFLATQLGVILLRFFNIINASWWKVFIPSYIALCLIVIIIWLICKADIR